MQSKSIILSVLLALTMVASNVVLSGHLSSHKTTGSDLCSLCVHAVGTDGVIASDSAVPQVIPPMDCPEPAYTSPYVIPVTLHVHPSRAPPHIS